MDSEPSCESACGTSSATPDLDPPTTPVRTGIKRRRSYSTAKNCNEQGMARLRSRNHDSTSAAQDQKAKRRARSQSETLNHKPSDDDGVQTVGNATVLTGTTESNGKPGSLRSHRVNQHSFHVTNALETKEKDNRGVDCMDTDATVHTEKPSVFSHVDIHFGSADIAGGNGRIRFEWDSVNGTWSFHLSGLKSMAELEIKDQHVANIKMCTNFENLFMVCSMTDDFAKLISDANGFSFKESQIVFHFTKTPDEEKHELVGVLNGFDQSYKNKVANTTLTAEEVNDIVKTLSGERLTLETEGKQAPPGESTEIDVRLPAKKLSNAKCNYFCLLIGLGEFAKEKCMMRFDTIEKLVAVFPDRAKNNVGYPLRYDKVLQCIYDKDHLVVAFLLDGSEAHALSDFCLRHTERNLLMPAECKLSRQAQFLRVLLKKTNELEYLEECLSSLGDAWQGSRSMEHESDFAYKAFPSHPDFKNLKRQPSVEPSLSRIKMEQTMNKSSRFDSSQLNGASKNLLNGTSFEQVMAVSGMMQKTRSASANINMSSSRENISHYRPPPSIAIPKLPHSPSNAGRNSGAPCVASPSSKPKRTASSSSCSLPRVGLQPDTKHPNVINLEKTTNGPISKSVHHARSNSIMKTSPEIPNQKTTNGKQAKTVVGAPPKTIPKTKRISPRAETLLESCRRWINEIETAENEKTTTGSRSVRLLKEKPADETPKPIPAAQPQEEAFIILSDDDNDDDNSFPQQPPAAGFAETVNVPGEGHEVFRSLHVFPEVVIGNACIRASDVQQLADGQMLGDGVVQFMLEFLRHCMNAEDQKHIHIFSYFFFQTFLGAVRRLDLTKTKNLPEMVFNRVRDHTKKLDIFSFEYLVIPVLKDAHWYLAIVCHPRFADSAEVYGRIQKPCIAIIDSLVGTDGSVARHKYTTDLIQYWLETEYRLKFDIDQNFQATSWPRISLKGPQQKNGVDCGVFLVSAVIQFLKDKPHFEPRVKVGNRFSGRAPKVSDWFFTENLAVEKQRLHMLHCYMSVAAVRCLTVYRDTYIPGMIEDLGKTVNEFTASPEVVTIEDSPVKSDKRNQTIQLSDEPKTWEAPQHSSCNFGAPKSDLGKRFKDPLIEFRFQYFPPCELPEKLREVGDSKKEFLISSGCYIPANSGQARRTVEHNIKNIAWYKQNKQAFWNFIYTKEKLDSPGAGSGGFERKTADQLNDEYRQLGIRDNE